MRVRLQLAVVALLAIVASAILPIGTTASAQVDDTAGRWIEVDTGSGVAMAVEDGVVVYSALVTVGSGNWPTPTGYFTINRRVINETMDSSTIGIPLGTPGSYYLPGVLYTQYFYGGVSLHYNYWSPPEAFGSAAGSHGCVGMTLEDSLFFWNFAGIGTPVIVY